jgi:uncharacterized protein
MVKYSRFAQTFDLGEVIALYHSLRMKPVYLSKSKYAELAGQLASSSYISPDGFGDLADVVSELIKNKILTLSDDEDNKVLSFVRSKIPQPAINVCYMILSEQCNLACRYCFLGNNDADKRKKFASENMSFEVADKAVDFFIEQIKLSGFDLETNKPIIIFYGGEPLVNFETLEYIANKVNTMRDEVKCLKNAEMSVITNGVLLTTERIKRLKELGVSIAISIDGFSVETNSNRVDKNNKPIFSRLLNVLRECQNFDANISLSVTLSEETIKDTQNVMKLIDEYGIKGFGFNIMMSDENFILPVEYNDAAADYIIKMFVKLREIGVYEDRIMRKLKAFTKSQVYFSDCAATSGGQVVISPNGQVGICHGCLSEKDYFVTSIDEEGFNAKTNPQFIEWSQLSPVNKEECLPCPALGICGGGCPINAMNTKRDNTIHSIDERFCIHAKKTLEFLISDLYRIIKLNNGQCPETA